MENGIKVNDFTKIFLYTLCKNSKIKKSEININKYIYEITLPYRYKDAIMCILSANPSWMKKYSTLINMEEYYRGIWEIEFSKYLNNWVKGCAETVKYEFIDDKIIIKIPTKYEKDFFINYYPIKIYETMNDLVSLINSYIYSRKCMLSFGPNCYAKGVEDYKYLSTSTIDPLEYVIDKEKNNYKRKLKK